MAPATQGTWPRARCPTLGQALTNAVARTRDGSLEFAGVIGETVVHAPAAQPSSGDIISTASSASGFGLGTGTQPPGGIISGLTAYATCGAGASSASRQQAIAFAMALAKVERDNL